MSFVVILFWSTNTLNFLNMDSNKYVLYFVIQVFKEIGT